MAGSGLQGVQLAVFIRNAGSDCAANSTSCNTVVDQVRSQYRIAQRLCMCQAGPAAGRRDGLAAAWRSMAAAAAAGAMHLLTSLY